MRKYTDGPWQASGDGWIESISGESVVDYAGCGSHEAKWASYADYRLAMAAPDLLEACRVASALLKGAPRSLGYDFDARQLDAAIQKAVGAEHA